MNYLIHINTNYNNGLFTSGANKNILTNAERETTNSKIEIHGLDNRFQW